MERLNARFFCEKLLPTEPKWRSPSIVAKAKKRFRRR
jgi:hypothetical protein